MATVNDLANDTGIATKRVTDRLQSLLQNPNLAPEVKASELQLATEDSNLVAALKKAIKDLESYSV